MFSQHFWILRGLMQFILSSVVPHLSDVLRCSRRALSAITMRSWWAQLGKVALVLRSCCAQKFNIFISKNNAIIVCSWRTKSLIFPIWAPFSHLSVTWMQHERDVSVTCTQTNCLVHYVRIYIFCNIFNNFIHLISKIYISNYPCSNVKIILNAYNQLLPCYILIWNKCKLLQIYIDHSNYNNMNEITT